MRMLYLFLGGNEKQTSVSLKIKGQIDAFQEAGIECYGVFISHKNKSVRKIDDHITLIPSPHPKSTLFKQVRLDRQLKRTALAYLTIHADQFDWVYYRYRNTTFSFCKTVKRFGTKLIVEHNANELGELNMYRSSLRLHPKLSSILSYVECMTRYLQEKHLPKYCLPKIRLGLANTPEMVNYQVKRAPGYNCHFLSNGLDFNQIPKKNYSTLSSGLNLLIMRGSYGSGYYDGYDRLLSGLAKSSLRSEVRIFFVGANFDLERTWVTELGLQEFVEFTGELRGEALAKVIDQCHLSIGPLALFRKGMTEGSILRVNDSFARGIPVVLAYKDVEVARDERFKEFVLQLDANEDALDIEELMSFAQSNDLKGQNGIDHLRNIALENLSYKIRTEKILELLNSLEP